MHDLGAFKLTGWQAGSEGSSQHTLRVGLEHCNRLQSIAGRDRDSGIEIISLRRTSNLALEPLPTQRWVEAYSWPRLSCCGGREVCSKLLQLYGFCDPETVMVKSRFVNRKGMLIFQ